MRFAGLGITLPQIDPSAVTDLYISPEEASALRYDGQGFEPKGILAVAAHFDESVGSALRRLSRFSVLGLEIPDVNPNSFDNVFIDNDEIKHFPYSSQITRYDLLEVAAYRKGLIKDTFENFRRFAPLITLPKIDPESFGDLTVDLHELKAFGHRYDEGITPVRLLRAAADLRESVDLTFERLRRFAPLGFALPDLSLEKLCEITADAEELDAAFGFYEELKAEGVLALAVQMQIPVQQALEHLRRFEALNIEIPYIDAEALDQLRPTRDDLIMLSGGANARPPWLTIPVASAHVSIVAADRRVAATSVRARLGRLLPALHPDLREALFTDLADFEKLATPFEPDECDVSAARLETQMHGDLPAVPEGDASSSSLIENEVTSNTSGGYRTAETVETNETRSDERKRERDPLPQDWHFDYISWSSAARRLTEWLRRSWN
jgi:hypothetical protein